MPYKNLEDYTTVSITKEDHAVLKQIKEEKFLKASSYAQIIKLLIKNWRETHDIRN